MLEVQHPDMACAAELFILPGDVAFCHKAVDRENIASGLLKA